MARIKSLVCAAAVSTMAVTLSTPSASAFSELPPDKIVIDVATVNGSGCRPGTAAVAVAPDNTAFTVTYSEYLAQAGAGTKPTDGRKNCQLSLDVHVPSGFTYAVARADYRGYASLAKGASAIERASYYFQGHRETNTVTHNFKGALDDNWMTSDETDFSQVVWHPCGERRNFNINTELRVNKGTSSPSSTSYMSMDSTDGSINTLYHFSWKRCPAK